MKKYKLINSETINAMKKMEANSVDCIFADPPYNMQTEGMLLRYEGTKFSGVDDDWDKFKSLEDYKNFTRAWLIEAKRILKEDGTIWVIGSFQNIYVIGDVLQELGYWILNDIIWNKTNPVPNFSGARFTNAHETLLWCSPSKQSKFTFNYKTMKVLNNGKQMKSTWNIPICNGNERIKNSDGAKLHNTQKPLELLKRVVLSSTKEGDLILDPFNGTGTTGHAALMYKRKYIGIDLDKKYIQATEERLANVKVCKDEKLVTNFYDRKAPLVDIKLLMGKYITEDMDIYIKEKNEYIATKHKFNENGRINVDGEEKSIHQFAKYLKNSQSENGWTYFYVKNNEEYILIDLLRKKYRKEILKYDEGE